ncbi:MAG: tripartite tricarboxylate transporter TctB family protein [Desulfovibrionaceae bacterium]|nr:tripartite tricarboxylate transporter TctB family protein [Desulfovibrionaceae bacterium]
MPVQLLLVVVFFVLMGMLGLFDHRPAALALIPDPLDAGGYPTIASTLLLISLGLAIMEELRLKAGGKILTIPPMSRPVAFMMLALIVYVIAFERLGFYVSTFAFCVAGSFLSSGGEKARLMPIVAYSLGTLVFWVIILKGFNLYLPSGLLF